MKLTIAPALEDELEAAFEYYEGEKPGLGAEFVEQFRHGIEAIFRFPEAWGRVDQISRRY